MADPNSLYEGAACTESNYRVELQYGRLKLPLQKVHRTDANGHGDEEDDDGDDENEDDDCDDDGDEQNDDDDGDDDGGWRF